jgi:hypothetical protein
MLIQAYRVESRRHGSIDFHPRPKLIGMVQFTGRDEQDRDEEAAIEILRGFSTLANHPALGFGTWKAELTSVDDDSLGRPFVENRARGYRLTDRSSPDNDNNIGHGDFLFPTGICMLFVQL